LVGTGVVENGEGEKVNLEVEKRKCGENEGASVGGARVVKERAGKGSNVVHSKQIYVHKYMSDASDTMWASKGVVVTVLNGEAIRIMQRRIFYAGFEKIDIIPLGAYKVLVRSTKDEDVSVMFSEAPYFFGNFFSSPVKWNNDVIVCERGAWVRIYGVPLHAWKINFFKFCVFDCGCLLKADEFTFEKEHLD
jgi:hypothetical protein